MEGEFIRRYRPLLNTQIPHADDWHRFDVIQLDEGKLLGGDQEEPLCEVEVELKSGTDADALAYARVLARKFALRPEAKSKYLRALELAATK